MSIRRLYAGALGLMAAAVLGAQTLNDADAALARAGFKAMKGVSLAGLSYITAGLALDDPGRACLLVYLWSSRAPGARQALLDADAFRRRIQKGGRVPGEIDFELLVVDAEGGENLADTAAMLGTSFPLASDRGLAKRLGAATVPALAVLAFGQARALRLGKPDFGEPELKRAVELLSSGLRAVVRSSEAPAPAPSAGRASPGPSAPASVQPVSPAQTYPTTSPAKPSPKASPQAASSASLSEIAQRGYALNAGLADDSFLSRLEREVMTELNLARTDPRGYAEKLRRHRTLYRGGLLEYPGRVPILTQEGVRAVDEAIAALERQVPLPPLALSRGLSLACRDHAADQGRTGRTGHIGADGSDPFKRMERYGAWQKTAGENIAYGAETAEQIVIQLIVDDGVPSRGHRKNIYDPDFLVAGLAVGAHAAYRRVCVIDFVGAYQEMDR